MLVVLAPQQPHDLLAAGAELVDQAAGHHAVGQGALDVRGTLYPARASAGTGADQDEAPANAPCSSTSGWPEPCTSCQVANLLTST